MNEEPTLPPEGEQNPTENNPEPLSVSKEVAEEIKIQAAISGAGKPLGRYAAVKAGFEPPKGPSLKERLEAASA